MQGRLIELTFERPLFTCVEKTILLTHERSRVPIEKVLEQVRRVKPTRHVTIFVSIPWQQKEDPNITNGFEDAHENFHFLFLKMKHLDEHVLVLEDDHLFWRILPSEVASIERFLATSDPDVYLLGHSSAFYDASHFPHIMVDSTSGLHAQFVHARVLRDWCGRGIHNFRKNKAAMDSSSNEYGITHAERRSVFSFWRPVVTQTFPYQQSNRHIWDNTCPAFERGALRMLMVDKFHTGWLVIYVYNWLRWLGTRLSPAK